MTDEQLSACRKAFEEFVNMTAPNTIIPFRYERNEGALARHIFSAALAFRQGEVEERAWLIEYVEARWGTGYFLTGFREFSNWGTIENAIRFSRKEDADRVISSLPLGATYEACEHIWPSPAQSAPEPQSLGDIVQQARDDVKTWPQWAQNNAHMASAEPAIPSGGADAPYGNCKYKICDLPGQCRSEGKCHHPKEHFQAQAAQSAPLADLAGWKMVPVEPTDEMDIAGMEASVLGQPSVDDESYVRSIWTAMLDAADACIECSLIGQKNCADHAPAAPAQSEGEIDAKDLLLELTGIISDSRALGLSSTPAHTWLVELPMKQDEYRRFDEIINAAKRAKGEQP